MAVRKVAKKNESKADETQARVVALAEQLGWFLGTVRGTADGLLANETMRREVSRVRDRASELLEQVNRSTAPAQKKVAAAAASAQQTVMAAGATAQKKVAEVGASAKKAVATAGTAALKAAGQATKATKKPVVVTVAKKRSGGTVDAPGKRHRKPPPQVHIGRGMGEPEGKQMGQKQFQPGKTARRG